MGKLKEILKNKWGWAGAVIGFLLNLQATLRETFIEPILGWIIKPEMGQIGIGLLIFLIVPAILGFIFGLIAQKLWRKFK